MEVTGVVIRSNRMVTGYGSVRRMILIKSDSGQEMRFRFLATTPATATERWHAGERVTITGGPIVGNPETNISGVTVTVHKPASLREQLTDPGLALCELGKSCPDYHGIAPRHAVRLHSVHRRHITTYTLGTEYDGCRAWCDCGWSGDKHGTSATASPVLFNPSVCRDAAIADYDKHVSEVQS